MNERAPTPERRAPTRLQSALWAALILATIALSLWDYDSFQVGVYSDDAQYVILARSLLRGQFGMINTPGDLAGPALYPMGYPLLLAPFTALFPHRLDALKALSLLATLLSAGVLFWGWPWFSRRSYNWALAVIALYSFGPVTVEHTRMVMSDAVFTTFTLVAIVLAEKLVKQDRPHWAHFGVLCGVSLFTPLIRTVGLLLLPCVGLYLWIKGNRRLRTWLVGLGLLLGLGVAALAAFPSQALFPARYLYGSDAAPLLGLYSGVAPAQAAGRLPEWYVTETATGERRVDISKVLDELWRYRLPHHLFQDLRQLVLPLGGGAREEALGAQLGWPGLSMAIGAGVLLLIVAGYLRSVKREGITLFGGFAVVYFATLLLWNWAGPRLLYPIQPQLYLALLEGIALVVIEGGGLLRQRKTGRILFAGALAALLALSAYRSLHLKDSRAHIGDLQTRTAWIVQHLPPDAVLMTEQPERDFIYGGRQTIRHPWLDETVTAPALLPETNDPGADAGNHSLPLGAMPSAEALYAYLVQHQVDYILIAPRVQWQAQYTPTYTENTRRMGYLLAHLAREDRVAQVYASETEMIYVFQCYRQE